MKKIFALAAAFVLMFALVACGGTKSGIADGVYTAQADDASTESLGYGWRDTLVLTLKGGKVTDAKFESYNAEGTAKSQAIDYEMDPKPADWIPLLSENIKKAASADAIDGIAGATNASTSARKLYAAILKDGKKGETISVLLG